MNDRTGVLSSPIRTGRYDLPNRIVMSAMTRSRATEEGIPTSLMALYYEQRATAGLIVTEAAQVSLTGVGYPFTPGIHNPEQADGWKVVTNSVHQKGGRIFCQLFHAGRISVPQLQPEGSRPVSASAVRPEGEAWTAGGMVPYEAPRPLEIEEVDMVTESYRRASEFALESGFDGVELHSANGYLPDQFLQDGTNHREDRYGGPPEHRIRFVMEVLEALIGVWGADRVGLHISPGNPFNSMHDSDPETLYTCLVNAVNPLGLAYLHVSEIDLGSPGTPKETNYNGGPNKLTRKLRQLYSGTYIANGGYTGESASRTLGSGEADLVSFGRPFISNPDLPERLRRGASLSDPDPATFYGGDARGYTDYPVLEGSRT